MSHYLFKPAAMVGLLSLSGLVFASEITTKHNDIDITIGQEIYKETYKEFVSRKAGLFVRHDAPVAALFAKIQVPLSENNKINLQGRYGFGLEKYTGALRGGEYGSVVSHGAPRSIYEIQATYSHTLPFLHLTPSIGGGYRRLTDHSNLISPHAYRRVSQYGYVMAGVSADIDVNDTVTLSPTFNYKYLVDARQYSIYTHQSKLFKQHDGHGIEVALPIKFAVSDAHHSVEITPFYRAWHIAKSDAVYGVNRKGHRTVSYEPKNTTQEIGINAAYTF